MKAQTKVAPKPVAPPSRQVLRQAARRTGKQPVGLPQIAWHKAMDFPKIIPAHKRRGGKAQSHKRILWTKTIGGREVQLHATKGYRSYRA